MANVVLSQEEVSLDTFTFKVNPRSIAWDFSLKTAEHRTIGGKVVQVYGVRLGDLSVGGKCSNADYMELYQAVLAITQAAQPTADNPAPAPVRFVWPARNWDFWVYVKSLRGPSGMAVEESNRNFAPDWTLTFFIAEDNSDIVSVAKEAAQASYIRRISQGLGWTQTSWNGPMGLDDLQAILQGQTLQAFLFNRWGEVNQTTGTTGDTTSGP